MTSSDRKQTECAGDIRPLRSGTLGLWQCVLGIESVRPPAAVSTDMSPERLYRETLSRKGGHKRTVALALEFPFEAMPVCRHAARLSVRQAVRNYLNRLFIEARIVGGLLRDNQTISHLFWLGDVSCWLTPAEVTEVMYRLGQYLHLRRTSCTCALMEVDYRRVDPRFCALLKGLGFTHLLFDVSSLPSLGNAEINTWNDARDCVEEFRLAAINVGSSSSGSMSFHLLNKEPEPSLSPDTSTLLNCPSDLLIGLGLGAWSVLDGQCFQNTERLNTYYAMLANQRLASDKTTILARSAQY